MFKLYKTKNKIITKINERRLFYKSKLNHTDTFALSIEELSNEFRIDELLVIQALDKLYMKKIIEFDHVLNEYYCEVDI